MSGITYLYASSIDYYPAGRSPLRGGRLAFSGRPDPEVIAGLGLEPDSRGNYDGNLYDIGLKGWQLKFVAPVNYEKQQFGGPIHNIYIFEKIVEEEKSVDQDRAAGR